MRSSLILIILAVGVYLSESKRAYNCVNIGICPKEEICSFHCPDGKICCNKRGENEGEAAASLQKNKCQGTEDDTCNDENGKCRKNCNGKFNESPTGKCTNSKCKCCTVQKKKGCIDTEDDTCKGEKGKCKKNCGGNFSESSSGKCTKTKCKCCLKTKKPKCKGTEDTTCKDAKGKCKESCEGKFSQSTTGSCSNSKCKCCVKGAAATTTTTPPPTTTPQPTTAPPPTTTPPPPTTTPPPPTTTTATTKTTATTPPTTTAPPPTTTTPKTTATVTTTGTSVVTANKTSLFSDTQARLVRMKKATDAVFDIADDVSSLGNLAPRKRSKRSLLEFNKMLQLLKSMKTAITGNEDLSPLEEEILSKRAFLAELKKKNDAEPDATERRDDIIEEIISEANSVIATANVKTSELEEKLNELSKSKP